MTSISRQEYQAIAAKPKRGNKFNAKRTLLDGILFDSKAESAYYASLKLRERAGEVSEIDRQRSYALLVNGVLVATYVADFVFWDRTISRRRVVDVKGVSLPAFKMKKKLMKACHGIDVEVAK